MAVKTGPGEMTAPKPMANEKRNTAGRQEAGSMRTFLNDAEKAID
jgi:hypothetical protein